MDEKAYWLALEYRLCREFSGMPEKHLRRWWCDGFAPEHFVLDDPEPRIIGKTWICKPELEVWEFVLFLDKPVASREEVNWSDIFPPENVTCWIAFDEGRKTIQIEPAAAVPDFRISN